jgi:hypothetical protein
LGVFRQNVSGKFLFVGPPPPLLLFSLFFVCFWPTPSPPRACKHLLRVVLAHLLERARAGAGIVANGAVVVDAGVVFVVDSVLVVVVGGVVMAPVPVDAAGVAKLFAVTLARGIVVHHAVVGRGARLHHGPRRLRNVLLLLLLLLLLLHRRAVGAARNPDRGPRLGDATAATVAVVAVLVLVLVLMLVLLLVLVLMLVLLLLLRN